jgi:adenylate cyclase
MLHGIGSGSKTRTNSDVTGKIVVPSARLAFRPEGAFRRMADVFISYARPDQAAAEKLAQLLIGAGHSVWWDRNIEGGAAFAKTIERELNAASVVVVLWSKHACDSDWVTDEAAIARDKGALLPISLDGTAQPIGFRQYQAIDFAGWHGGADEPRVQALLSAIASRLGAATTAPPRKTAARKRPYAVYAGVTTATVAAALVAFAFLQRQGKESGSDVGGTAEVKFAEGSVAVLPFVALSSGEDDGYFADGLTEEIINALTTVPDLLVTARTSAFHFKGKDTPVPEIARALGVAHVVEGSVRRSGKQARIAAQLIRAADGFHLWSNTYDRPLDDAFAVQTDIAEHVAAALGVLLDDRQRRMMADAGVRDVDAFIAYQRALELFNRAHNDGPLVPLLAQANVEFDVAIARAPDFAQAHFQHADYYAHFLIDEAPGKGANFRSDAGLDVAEAERRLIDDLDAALRYEKDAGQRRVIEAVRTTVTSDWRGLEDQIRLAYAAWDNCRFGLWLDQTGILFGFGEAVYEKDLERTRCDPLGSTWYRAAESAIWIGRPRDGLELADRAEAAQGRNSYVMHARILANLALGRTAEAGKLLAEGRFGSPDIPEFQRLLLHQVPAAAGRRDLWSRSKTDLARDPEQLLVAAAVYGDRETANRTAAQIDAMRLGPAILIRITDRCGCGKPFDLSATPKFARILSDAGLAFEPLQPIDFPLKDW